MLQLPLPLDGAAMRWRQGRASYRPQREQFDPRHFGVEQIGDAAARAFVLEHHYSRSYPAAIAAFGLIERTSHSDRLTGVAVFSVPMNGKAARRYGAADAPFCDLGRFVLLDEIAGNAETWFLSRALAGLSSVKTDASSRPLHHLVLAYSDPQPRTAANGDVIFAGHVGGIYAAASAIYLGRGTARVHWVAQDATLISPRALSKLRNGERGDAYVYEQLLRHGAPRRRLNEPAADYVSRALAEGPFRRLRHRGNHVYCLPTGTHRMRRAARGLKTFAARPTHCDPVVFN
ncbi:MAG: hypothetical protein H6872_05690 [Methylobacteriaceae bacterium]|nr:hypothetical protein [Methylobacteriaceae bacterium]